MERGAGTTLLQRDTISELNELFQIPTIVCRSSMTCGFYKLELALETVVIRPNPFQNSIKKPACVLCGKVMIKRSLR